AEQQQEEAHHGQPGMTVAAVRAHRFGMLSCAVVLLRMRLADADHGLGTRTSSRRAMQVQRVHREQANDDGAHEHGAEQHVPGAGPAAAPWLPDRGELHLRAQSTYARWALAPRFARTEALSRPNIQKWWVCGA